MMIHSYVVIPYPAKFIYGPLILFTLKFSSTLLFLSTILKNV